ncbi:MAG: TlpA family protein disulfide reductase [Candidatus Hydrogenedentes bacterium]|nr:TlpA family protein disulfide reductase [Candidatus Hydrogenedentota bacterium]
MKHRMKSMPLTIAALAAVIALGAVVNAGYAQGDVEKRKIGDAAPEISVSEWVQGGPVALDSTSGKNVYLIEFWATWCPPCRKSIPHLNDLYATYKDRGLQVVAISNEEADHVAEFVKLQGDKMVYPVAIDGNGTMIENYMTAFGQDGIPHVFLVDTEGKIAWHGHPMSDELGKELEKRLPKKESKG